MKKQRKDERNRQQKLQQSRKRAAQRKLKRDRPAKEHEATPERVSLPSVAFAQSGDVVSGVQQDQSGQNMLDVVSPVDTGDKYQEVWLIKGVDQATGRSKAWAQGVLNSLDPSCYVAEVHGEDLHLLPVPTSTSGRSPAHRLKQVVNYYEWQFRSEQEHAERLYSGVYRLGEQLRQQLRAGESPNVAIPPGLDDIYLPVLQRVFEEEGVVLQRPSIFESPLEEQFWNTWCQIYSFGSFLLTPQYRIGSYRVDFAEIATKTVIEIDGAEAHSGGDAITRDRQRERAIEQRGWHVVRFGGKEVYHNTERCVRELMAILLKNIQGGQGVEVPWFIRLLPSCGCCGDAQGFMSEIMCLCGCQQWKVKYEGIDGEQVAATMVSYNADPALSTEWGEIRLILLPGIFSLDWHQLGYPALIGKWPSIEAYWASEEAQRSVSCGH